MIYQILSIVGAILILAAYGANQAGKLNRETALYQLLNIFGGVALCVTAVAMRQLGFIILEGAWTLVSVWAFVDLLRRS